MRGTLWTLLIAALMLLMLYRRFTFVGRFHRIRPLRMHLRVALWLLLGTTVALAPWVSLPLAAGAMVLGTALAFYSLSVTEFAADEKGLKFKTNTWIGTALFVLFAARVVWRLIDRFVNGRPFFRRRFADPEQAGSGEAEHMPVTLMLLFLFIGYQITYRLGIVIIARRKRAAKRRRELAAAEAGPAPLTADTSTSARPD